MAIVETDLVQQNPDGAYQAPVVIAVNADGSAIGGGGDGGGGTVDQGAPGTSAWLVSGPITNAQFTAVEGTAATAAWSGTGSGTVVAVLKAIHAQNAQVIALLEDIEVNTRKPVDPAPTG